MKFSALVVILISSITTACNYRLEKAGAPDADPPITTLEFNEPDYQAVHQKLFAPKCLECHSAVGGNRGGVNLESYTTVIKALNQAKASIADGSMPRGRKPLSASQRKLFFAWVKAGAPEKKGVIERAEISSVQPTDEIKMNYATVNRLVIQTTCVTCHSAANPKGHLNLESFAEIQAHLDKIKKVIEDGSMPKKGEITPAQKELFLTWINNGAPENSERKFSPNQIYQSQPQLIADEQPQDEYLARGKYLFNLAACANCHSAESAKPLAGGNGIESPFGTFFPPNISPDPKTGIGALDARTFLQAMRYGIGPKGKLLYPSFPYTSYSKMTDDDILSIRAYIMTLPGIEQENRAHQISFPFNQRWLMSLWMDLYFSPGDPNLGPGPYREIPERSLTWNRGAYLVEGPLHCTQCHTPRGELGGLKVNMWLAGSTVSGGSTPAPNITPDPETGLKEWTSENWNQFLVTGSTPRGEKVSGEMWKVIKGSTSQLTAADRAAVVEYLMSVKPVVNKVR